MGNSTMVITWPSHDAEAEDDSYVSVMLSQCKAPYEMMPLPDPDPPFVAALDLASTSVRVLPLMLQCLPPFCDSDGCICGIF